MPMASAGNIEGFSTSNRTSELPASRVVVIFGESSVGKSSLVNIIYGRKVAEPFSYVACGFMSKRYAVAIDGVLVNLWETSGLDGKGEVAAKQVRVNLFELIYSWSNRACWYIACTDESLQLPDVYSRGMFPLCL